MFNNCNVRVICLLVLPLLALKNNIIIAQQRPPNILIVLTDDQGYHDVSYYGTEDIQTPNIDGISTRGMRLDNFYAW